jgi:ribonuclease P protein component
MTYPQGREKISVDINLCKSCNDEFYLRGIGEDDETYLSTIRDAKKADPWFSGSHENFRWSGGYSGSPGQGADSPWGLTQPELLGSFTIRFPKTHRLHKAEEFSSVIRFRCSASSEFLQIFAKPNNLSHSRLGLVVAGKVERLAVNRNRVKRTLRAAFRARQRDLTGLDIVVRLRSRVSHDDSLRMAGEAERLMVQLQRCRG